NRALALPSSPSFPTRRSSDLGKLLRVYVEDGGCSGLQYGLTFDEKRENDLTAEWFGLSVCVDPFSANYLQGAVVDFSEALTGGGDRKSTRLNSSHDQISYAVF